MIYDCDNCGCRFNVEILFPRTNYTSRYYRIEPLEPCCTLCGSPDIRELGERTERYSQPVFLPKCNQAGEVHLHKAEDSSE